MTRCFPSLIKHHCWWCVILLLFPILSAEAQNGLSNVQSILKELSVSDPGRVNFLLETRRWHLNEPWPGSLPADIETKLEEAFYADVAGFCKSYGWKYLTDWKLLVAKAGRETFWGTSYLCNRTNNYFGIRRKAKGWVCFSFGFCDVVSRKDPDLAEFVVFPDFRSSVWMFIHTIYSDHFLARLPDRGRRVKAAIDYEREFKTHYWQAKLTFKKVANQLDGPAYTANELVKSWSGYPKNNLCVNCDVQSDLKWLKKIDQIAKRVANLKKMIPEKQGSNKIQTKGF